MLTHPAASIVIPPPTTLGRVMIAIRTCSMSTDNKATAFLRSHARRVISAANADSTGVPGAPAGIWRRSMKWQRPERLHLAKFSRVPNRDRSVEEPQLDGAGLVEASPGGTTRAVGVSTRAQR